MGGQISKRKVHNNERIAKHTHVDFENKSTINFTMHWNLIKLSFIQLHHM